MPSNIYCQDQEGFLNALCNAISHPLVNLTNGGIHP